MDLRGRRLLILGGSIQCLKVVSAAKEMGIYTIVTDISASKEVSAVADEILPYSVMDVNALYNWCQKNPVDGIINYCIDFSQHSHQILCEKLNLPCFGTAEQYHALTDKTKFKELCINNFLDVIPEYDESNLNAIEYPVLIKPAESSGSRGINICYSRVELNDMLIQAKNASRNDKIIIEKYMGGKQDFTVTFLVVDGKPYLIRLGDRHLGRVEDGLNRQCVCTTSPSLFNALYFNNVHHKVLQMIRNLKMNNGPIFLQGFIDGDKFRFYDPGIRFPGGEYDRLFYAATGIDIVSAMVSYALTGKLAVDGLDEKSYLLNGKVAVQLTLAAKPGTISEYSGFEEIDKIPSVICVAQKAHIGKIIPASSDVKQRVIEVDFLAQNRKDIGSIAKEIYTTLRILDENGSDMLVSKFDGERVC